ncbi:MAG TPA: VWA domain-containing protein [Pyrinomonadaceae bacterium]|jgi:VWFA-related protein|nr:VWA domain-containing protein [Pyrinomonadaceae bacterium]
MKRFLLVCLFLAAASPAAFAQTPSPTPDEDDRDVVKITTNLIQIDVTVTDSKGRLVTDLKPEEIEIFENDDKQTITNFSFINAAGKENPPLKKPDKNAAPVPEVPRLLRPEQVKRMIALVVDDLSLSFESTAHVRQALKKFVDEQMQPEDMVAIIRTGSGVGALQQFTSNKRQLYAAIEGVRWNPAGKADISAVAPIDSGLPDYIRPLSLIGKQPDEDTRELEQYRQDVYTVGTLGSINYIVRGMRGLPGRKSIVLFSDGFKLQADDFGMNPRTMTGLRLLTDLANRAAVVIYTMDARGLQPLGLTAADSIGGLDPKNVTSDFNKLNQRSGGFFDSQSGLNYLAKVTGGIAIRNQNDLSDGLEKILDDQKGYYLVGYQPDGDTFDPIKRRFNNIDVRVTRPGLKVRFRSGFFGITDENIKPTFKNAQEQVIDALTSPFTTGEITIRLTPIFTTNDIKQGYYISSLIHVKASDLKFTDEPDGWKKIVFDVVAIVLGDNGVLVDQLSRAETIKVKDDTYEKILRDGFVYAVPFPIKKPGAYQLRIALRDAETTKIGSANQFIEVPDLKKPRLVVSDIILQNVEAKKGQNDSVAPDDSASDYLLNTALRQFKSGSALFYNTTIFNPKISSAGKPDLKTQVKIFRDGQEVFTSEETPYVLDAYSNFKKLTLRGALRLGEAMPPGQYILQIIVRDIPAKEKNRLQTKWIDFEIVK